MWTAIVACLLAAPGSAPDTVVVCPRAYVGALAPWLSHREAQGHDIELLSNTRTPQDLREQIRSVAAKGRLRFVLLIGDVDTAEAIDAASRATLTPTVLVPAKVNVAWGSESHIASDNYYADLDGDMLPDVAVGRISVDSREELAVVIDKILRYERSTNFEAWRRRVSFVAGIGNFGKLADTVIETAAKSFLTEGIPAAFQTTMTYGNWQSPYCPDPRRFHETTVKHFNDGCLLWVYIGHGERAYLDKVYVPGSSYDILKVTDVAKLQSTNAPPIAVFLSCYAGAFDGANECLAEEMLRSPSGPVAVYAGSRITMPYAMAVMSTELMHEVFHGDKETLGEMIIAAKRRLASSNDKDAPQSERRALLDALSRSISPTPESMDDERLEHVVLFNLLGDPLLRLRRPTPAFVEVDKSMHAGATAQVAIRSGLTGDCRIELVCRRDRLRFTPPEREYYDGRDRFLREYDDVYRDANDTTWFSKEFTFTSANQVFDLPVPPDARGPSHVRVYIQGQDGFSMGSADTYVRRPVNSALPK